MTAVLPLIRTRADLRRYSAANAHGRDMHEALDVFEALAGGHGDGRAVAAHANTLGPRRVA